MKTDPVRKYEEQDAINAAMEQRIAQRNLEYPHCSVRYCSSCGCGFHDPGKIGGYSHCENHKGKELVED